MTCWMRMRCRRKLAAGRHEFVRRHLNWDQVAQDMEVLLFSVVQAARKDAEW